MTELRGKPGAALTPFWRLGRAKSIGALVSLGLAAGLGLGWISYRQSRGLIEQSQERGRSALAHGMAEGLVDLLLTENYAGMESRLVQAMADENLASVLVVDSTGRVLVHLQRRRPDEAPELFFSPKRLNPPGPGSELPVISNGFISRWSPIEAGLPTAVGWLQLRSWSSSTDSVLNLLLQQYLVLAALTAGLVATLLVSAYLQVYRQTLRREQQHNKEKAVLEHFALIDPLTGLYNRRGVEQKLTDTLQDPLKRAAAALAICMIDLDDFKPVNDTYGHEIGDQLLVAVAQRLRSFLREGDCVGRMGGDEFLAVFRQCSQREIATALAQRISHGLSQPFQIGELLVRIGASVGVVLDSEQLPAADHSSQPSGAANLQNLMKQADDAMYQAKQNRKKKVSLAPPASGQ